MITLETIRYTHGKLITPHYKWSGFRIWISNATKLCICNAHLGLVNKSIFISAGDSGLLISVHTYSKWMNVTIMQWRCRNKMRQNYASNRKNEDGTQNVYDQCVGRFMFSDFINANQCSYHRIYTENGTENRQIFDRKLNSFMKISV